MSDKPTAPPPDESDSKAGNGNSMKSLVMICLIAAIVGGGAGAMVLGPKFRAQPAATEDGEEEAGDHGAEAKGGHGEILSIGNLIINPAGSQGTRFLMVTVGIEATSKEAMASLREQELAVRDAIGSLLESKSLAELTQFGARDTIRAALADKLKPMAGASAKIRVYLPQYVIQ